MGKKNEGKTNDKGSGGKSGSGGGSGGGGKSKGGKGGKADAEEKDTKVKGAQSINVRHILVSS
jgi:hypothetical protein